MFWCVGVLGLRGLGGCLFVVCLFVAVLVWWFASGCRMFGVYLSGIWFFLGVLFFCGVGVI